MLPGTDACLFQERDTLLEMKIVEDPLEILYLLTPYETVDFASKLVCPYMPIDKARIATKSKFKDLPGLPQARGFGAT